MQKVDLLEGSIVRSLTSLALPIMATSLIQMAYNMTDMIWIGRVSANKKLNLHMAPGGGFVVRITK